MIVSHRYKFIFLKTQKTAGTSIEVALSRFCGEKDIITTISPADEETRRSLGYRGPQNHLAALYDYGIKDLMTYASTRKKKRRFNKHMSAKEAKMRVGTETWDRYYKFCFERNPWDRVISLYYWYHKTEPRPSISDFIDSGAPLSLKRKGFDVYTIDGEMAVDRVCLYENLQQELDDVQARLGLPDRLELPQAKGSFRKDKRSYRDILSAADRDKIAEMFEEEISLFGYRF